MNPLRLAEILLPLLAARSLSPWQTAPETLPEVLLLRRRMAPALPGNGARSWRAAPRLFDDVQ